MTSQVNGTKNGCIMKNFNKIFFAAVAAAFGLVSCSQELTPVEKPQGNLVTVNFGAEASIEPATKATLTTEDELTFKSAWENGDALSVKYSNDNETAGATTSGVVSATWSTDHFEAQMPEYNGMWDYNVVYPEPDANSKVDFGSARTQKGNAYNSKYDLMKGSAIAEGADAGKTAAGENIVFNMKRQTAVAYFHLKSALDEEVVSAKLSVTDGKIASSSVKLSSHTTGFDLSTKDLDEITITFDEGTAPKASDFQLWFNVLPTNYTKMTLTVETAGHKLTLNNKTAGEFKAENLYKTVLTPEAGKWIPKSTPEFTDFSRFTGPIEEGYYLVVYQNKAMKALIKKDRLQYDAVNASNGIITKPGTGIIWQVKKYGEYWTLYNPETKTYAASTGAASKAALLNSVEDKALWTITKDKDDYEFVNKANKAANVNCNLRNNGTYGFACYATSTGGALSLYKLLDPSIPTLSIDQTSKTWASDATDAFVVNVTVNSEGGDWNVTPTTLDWAFITVDKTTSTLTVTPKGENTAATPNEATILVSHASDAMLTKSIILKQEAASPIGESKTSTLTLSSSKKFGTKTGSTLNADDKIVWTVNTVTGAIQNSYQNDYFGQQFGTGKAAWTGTFVADYSNKTISKIEIVANTGSKATISVKVGDTSFGQSVSITQNLNKKTTYSFEGSANGKVSLSVSNTSKAFYLGEIKVTYTE